MTKTYDRQEKETTKAYTAFTIYRDMESARSLDRVEEKIYGTQIGHKRGTNLTSLKRWSREWNWVERCRDYDLDRLGGALRVREAEMRQIKSDCEKAAYIQDLEHYQLQQKEIGMMTLNLANRSLESISLILEPIHQALKASDGVIPRDRIDLLFTSQLAAKNLMMAATSGAELAAKGLVIEQLLDSIECEIDARSR
jgi:hypothetical protein